MNSHKPIFTYPKKKVDPSKGRNVEAKSQMIKKTELDLLGFSSVNSSGFGNSTLNESNFASNQSFSSVSPSNFNSNSQLINLEKKITESLPKFIEDQVRRYVKHTMKKLGLEEKMQEIDQKSEDRLIKFQEDTMEILSRQDRELESMKNYVKMRSKVDRIIGGKDEYT